MRFLQRGHLGGNACKNGFGFLGFGRVHTSLGKLLLFLLCFDRFPVPQHFCARIGLHVAKHVRMAINQLRRKAIKHVVYGEIAGLFRHLGIEKHLEKEVSQFARELIPITIVDRFVDFVSFFVRVRLDGIEGLLAIPGTPTWRAQAGHYLNCALEAFASGRIHGLTNLNDRDRASNFRERLG